MDSEFNKRFLKRLLQLSGQINDRIGRKIMFMEVCGTHTTVISKSGLRGILAGHMELRSGPGCPVCVTDQADIDTIIALSRLPDTIVATFGDMIRVPGAHSSLEQERARGARVETFYSPREAVTYAAGHPDKEVIFLGVGFETTIPAIALSLLEARAAGIKNYSIFSVHKVVPPAMKALLNDPEQKIDGFILPGHVCTITGRKAFDFISSDYRFPAVIGGFEEVDVMGAIYLLLRQILDGRVETMNGYRRLVHEDGNIKAQEIMGKCFDPADVSWRGFGSIPGSGLRLKAEYATHDARVRFPIEVPPSSPPEGCSCGEVLRGKLRPDDCPLFSSVCTPVDPVGPCMVSTEGACAAYYQYGIGY